MRVYKVEKGGRIKKTFFVKKPLFSRMRGKAVVILRGRNFRPEGEKKIPSVGARGKEGRRRGVKAPAYQIRESTRPAAINRGLTRRKKKKGEVTGKKGRKRIHADRSKNKKKKPGKQEPAPINHRGSRKVLTEGEKLFTQGLGQMPDGERMGGGLQKAPGKKGDAG